MRHVVIILKMSYSSELERQKGYDGSVVVVFIHLNIKVTSSHRADVQNN